MAARLIFLMLILGTLIDEQNLCRQFAFLR